jgi:DNA-binding response OmpR family regulator
VFQDFLLLCVYAQIYDIKYKLIIIGLGMPNKDGFEACKEILEIEKKYDVK